MPLEDLNNEDIETLKKLLQISGRCALQKRTALCIEINLEIGNISNISADNDFAIELIDQLLKRKLNNSIYKLCEVLKPLFKEGGYSPNLEKILSKLNNNSNAEEPDKENNRISIKLHTALLGIDFVEQEDLFKKVVFGKGHSVGALIIHGNDKYGQRWLLNRLMRIIEDLKGDIKVIKISLSPGGGYEKNKATWSQLQEQLNLRSLNMPKDEMIDAVCNAVCKFWRDQHVVFIFHIDSNFLGLLPEWLEDIINNFWIKLVICCKKTSSSHKLLMFLVDYSGIFKKEDKNLNKINLTDSFDISWQPEIPIKLPPIKKISKSHLKNWIKCHSTNLPPNLIIENGSYQDLLDKCQRGLPPQEVLEEICKKCGHDWYQTESIWLKH